MYIGGISGQLWTVASTTYGISVGAVASVFLCCWLLLRWKRVNAWIQGRMRGKNELKIKNIFNDYLKSVSSIRDRRELYTEILKIISGLAKSEDISLLIYNQATRRFVVRECIGSKPMSFQIGEINEFVNGLSKYKKTVTRAEIVESSEFVNVKSSGLQYCVQFHAEAIVPLVLGEELIGIINLGNKVDGHDYENHLIEAFDLMSSQFAVAINNANLYEGLVRQNVQLKQLDELKTQLLANVSHELRTPLNSIIGLSELMIDGADGELNKEQQMHLQMIKDSGSRLLDTVSALLDLSKLEANKLALDIKRISLNKMVEDVTKTVQIKDRVKLEVSLDDNTPQIYGDELWLSRVFKNLLSNAVKYTPAGRIYIDCDRAGDMLKIGVHDTGIGIKKEDQKGIFKGFSQVSTGLNREHEGTGVGLAISKKIVELHGGRIWLDSSPGKGSHFFFTLPLKPNSIPSVELTPFRKKEYVKIEKKAINYKMI